MDAIIKEDSRMRRYSLSHDLGDVDIFWKTGAEAPETAVRPRRSRRQTPIVDLRPMDDLFLKREALGKRVFDFALSSLAVILLSPAFVAVALAIKFTSEGPIIFRQQRAGLGGKPFTIYKFRSMRLNAEAERDRLLSFNERGGPAFKMTNDPRVTPVGRFIRKWSLDELPQLFNVVKGDMSLVGPRPLPVMEDRQCERWQAARRRVRPGVTCIWQVSSRHESDFDHWARLDIRYARSQSAIVDLALIAKTVPAVLLKKGAC